MLPKEVRRATGLSEKAMRLYEEKGLIAPTVRETGGKRLRDYSDADVRLLGTIASLRRARFSLDQIGRMLRDPACVPDVFEEYKADLIKEAAEIEDLLIAVSAVDSAGLDCAEELARAISPLADPMPLPERDRDYRPYRWEEITEEERREAFAKFWAKQEKRLDRQLFFESMFSRIGRVTVRVILPLAVVFLLLYMIPAREEIDLMIPAVEYDRESGAVVSTTTIRLCGEIRRYLFREDYYEGSFAVDGFTPYSQTYATLHGMEYARHDDPLTVRIPLVERGYTYMYPTDSKFVYRLFRDPTAKPNSLSGTEYLWQMWFLEPDDPSSGVVMDVMEPTSSTGWSSGNRALIAPAGNSEDAEKLWELLTQQWAEMYDQAVEDTK